MPRNTSRLRKGGQPGRKKGSKNKATIEIKELARRLVQDPEYLAALRERLIAGKLHGSVEALLWAYAYGKQRDTLDLNVSAERKTLIVVPHSGVSKPDQEQPAVEAAVSTVTLPAEPPLRLLPSKGEPRTYGPSPWPKRKR